MISSKQREGVVQILTYYYHTLYFCTVPQNVYKKHHQPEDTKYKQFKTNLKITVQDMLQQSTGDKFSKTVAQLFEFFQQCVPAPMKEAHFKKLIISTFIPLAKADQFQQDSEFRALKMVFLLVNKQIIQIFYDDQLLGNIVEQTLNHSKIEKYKGIFIPKIQSIITESIAIMESQLLGIQYKSTPNLHSAPSQQRSSGNVDKYKNKARLLLKQNLILKQKLAKLEEIIAQTSHNFPLQSQKQVTQQESTIKNKPLAQELSQFKKTERIDQLHTQRDQLHTQRTISNQLIADHKEPRQLDESDNDSVSTIKQNTSSESEESEMSEKDEEDVDEDESSEQSRKSSQTFKMSIQPSVQAAVVPQKKQSFKATRNVSTFNFEGL